MLKLVTKNETVPLTKKEATICASKMYNQAWVTSALETGVGPKPSCPKETQKTTDMWKSLVRWEAPKKKPAAKPAAKPADAAKPAAKPVSKPAAKPAAKPVSKPGRLSGSRGRSTKKTLRLHGPGTVSPKSPKGGKKQKTGNEEDSEEQGTQESDEETPGRASGDQH
jgi:hypothetical protein